MVATLLVFCDFGGAVNAPGTEQDADAQGPPQLRFKYADNNTIDNNDPIPVPPSGTTRSRWKHFYLQVSVAPDTQIDNMKIFGDGTGFGTGITVLVGDGVQAKTDIASAGYDVSDTQDEIITGHDTISTSTNFFTTYTSSGSSRTVTISEALAQLDAVNETTDYIVLSMEVLNTASQGDLTDESLTIEYDEI